MSATSDYVRFLLDVSFVMVALYGIGQTGRPLYFCPVVSFFYLFFFPRLISAAADWMSTILRHLLWP